MNKRIKELALQAGIEMCGCGCDMPTRQTAKFAELLIRECVEKCKTDWYGDSLDDICVKMMEHFAENVL